MGLQLLWSFGLACLDIYSLQTKRDLHNPVLVSLFVVGDWVSDSFLIYYSSNCFSICKKQHEFPFQFGNEVIKKEK
jgi:diacylglycerol kinase family enzyme